MRESFFIFLSICGLFFGLSLFSSLNATTSTQIVPAASTSLQPQVSRCYGPTKQIYDSASVSYVPIQCATFPGSANRLCRADSYVMGAVFECQGGDAWTACTAGCNLQCGAPSLSPDTCAWK